MKNFFSHDEGARNDPKLIKVLMRLGQAGKGVYWDLVEMLYEQGGYLILSECESYAFALRTECTLIQSLVNDFGLFVSDGERFWSESALRRLELRRTKSQKAAESAQKRWDNANAMRTHSESNAIKGKEKKLKEIKESTSSSTPAENLESPTQQVKIPDEPKNETSASETNLSGDSYFDFSIQLKSERQFMDNAAMSLKIKLLDLPPLIDQFTQEQRALSKQYKEFIDFKSHCFNWLRIQATKPATQQHGNRSTPNLALPGANRTAGPVNTFGQGADLTGIVYKQESFK